MDTRKLDKWADLLLDTGKRNNLINFKDTRVSTVKFCSHLLMLCLQRWKGQLHLRYTTPKSSRTMIIWRNLRGLRSSRVMRWKRSIHLRMSEMYFGRDMPGK